MTPEEERIGWLDCLIDSYERVRHLDPDAREDPNAAYEMLRECRALAKQLRDALPPREADQTAPAKDYSNIPF